MSSNVARGKKAERNARSILEGMGWTLAARSKGTPVWRQGAVVRSGDNDLLEGTLDFIFFRGEQDLCVSVTHVNSESPRRAKMRKAAARFGGKRWWMILAWDAEIRAFRVNREVDDFLFNGLHLRAGDMALPWEQKTTQVFLEK